MLTVCESIKHKKGYSNIRSVCWVGDCLIAERLVKQNYKCKTFINVKNKCKKYKKSENKKKICKKNYKCKTTYKRQRTKK